MKSLRSIQIELQRENGSNARVALCSRYQMRIYQYRPMYSSEYLCADSI